HPPLAGCLPPRLSLEPFQRFHTPINRRARCKLPNSKPGSPRKAEFFCALRPQRFFRKFRAMLRLEQNKLFGSLEKEELQRLEESSEQRAFPAGAEIFHEGDEGDGLY